MSTYSYIKKRLWLLTLLAALGGALFVPFILASPTETPSALTVFFIFTLGATAVTFISAWFGLHWADRAELPMPLLRRFESKTFSKSADTSNMLLPIGISVALGIAIALLSFGLNIPENPGNFLERIATSVFAAVVPEVLVHLFLMSGLVLLVKRTWLAVLLSAIAFVILFHGSPPTTPFIIPVFVVGLNFSLAILTGWAYATRGFESAVLAHGIVHFIALAFN